MRQDAANPAVKSWIVGRVLSGEFDYGAIYVVEDLDGYWAYQNHPAQVRREMEGIPLIEKFTAIDVTDSDDPRSARRSPGCRPPLAAVPRAGSERDPGGLVSIWESARSNENL
jgi:hypothetical protein